MEVQGLIDDVIGLVVPDDPGGLASLTKDLITLRNATEATLAVCAARIDRLGLAKKAGSTTSKWLQDNGAAPASASRWIRLGTGLARLDRTAGYFRDGFLSTEHVDAIVKGVRQISGRSAEAVTDEKRLEFERKLLSHAMSGAPPTEIDKIAQGLGNQVAKDTGGLAPAEDPSLNKMDYGFSEGRLVGRFDVDKQIGEKLFSALDAWSKPRPEPDGSDDVRSPTQRRADALHQLLDCGGGGGDGLVSGPRTEVNVSVPADHPERASLEWMGPITEALAKNAGLRLLDGLGDPRQPGRADRHQRIQAVVHRQNPQGHHHSRRVRERRMGRARCSEERGSAATERRGKSAH